LELDENHQNGAIGNGASSRWLVAGDVEFFKVAVEGNDLHVVFVSTGGKESVRESDVDRLEAFERRMRLGGVAELYAAFAPCRRDPALFSYSLPSHSVNILAMGR